MTLKVGFRIRIDAEGFSVRGVYEITHLDHQHCEGRLVGPDGKMVEPCPYKIIGYEGIFSTPVYDPEDKLRPGTNFLYAREDVEKLLPTGEAVPLRKGEPVGPIPKTNRGAW